MGKMLASVLDAKQHIVFKEQEIPPPGDGEVLIRISRAGICGSDLHRYNCDWDFKAPITLGHEASGIVAAVGRGVVHLKEGDAVTVEPAKPCLKCPLCLQGRYNLCPDLKFIPVDMPGAFAEYLLFDATFVYRLPRGVDMEEGALIEPLAVALHAVEQSETGPGRRTAVVLGVGTIGLLAVMCLRAYGVTDIIAADIMQNRLTAAKSAGAAHTVNLLNHDLLDTVEELTNGRGTDIVIEASGNVRSAMSAPHIVGRGGVIVQVGIVAGEVSLNYPLLMRKEATLKQSYKYVNNFKTALALIEARMLPVKSIITQMFPFARLDEALSFTSGNPEKCIKTIVVFDTHSNLA